VTFDYVNTGTAIVNSNFMGILYKKSQSNFDVRANLKHVKYLTLKKLALPTFLV